MARCQRCYGCESMWDTDPCKYCGFPGKDTRDTAEIIADMWDAMERNILQSRYDLEEYEVENKLKELKEKILEQIRGFSEPGTNQTLSQP